MNSFKRWIFLSWLSFKYVLLIIGNYIGFGSSSTEKLIRKYMEEAGGAFVKLGQILALRYEFLPPSFCLELAELFDNVAPMDYYTVWHIVQNELKQSPAEMFIVFEEQPVASASFGQVHRAILKDGKEVAVKVQRPNLLEKIKFDFKFLRFMAVFATPVFNIKALRLDEIIADLEETSYRELDYRIEKDSAEKVRKNVKSDKFYIPKTYTEYTTKRVLIQDFVKGIKVNDIVRARTSKLASEAIKLANYNLDDVAESILEELARQYYEDGFYHGDPHPGNIILTSDGKIALVDFGIMGSVKKYSRSLFWNFIKHVSKVGAEPLEASKAFLRLGLRPIEDRIRFLANGNERPINLYFKIIDELAIAYEKILLDIMEGWSSSLGKPGESLYERSTAVNFIKAMRLAEDYDVHFQKDLVPFIRTLVIGDMMAMQISPTFKMTEALHNFEKSCPEVVKDMEKYLEEHHEVDDEKLSDPWNESIRDDAKEFLIEWLANLTENRATLYQKIKPQVELLKKEL
jgi:predicted unusual protein kinase regulating ubiquinone biosynthesis (AarF/ABC1/UbiB family)